MRLCVDVFASHFFRCTTLDMLSVPFNRSIYCQTLRWIQICMNIIVFVNGNGIYTFRIFILLHTKSTFRKRTNTRLLFMHSVCIA